MKRFAARLSVSVFTCLASGAGAQMREIEGGGLIADPRYAYIAYHMPPAKLPAQPIFMQIPRSDGTEGRLYAARNSREFSKDKARRVYLLEVPPGDYLIYGLSMSVNSPNFVSCMCLGTVSFRARPGVVVDLGAVLIGDARSPSPYPELATETNLGPSIDNGFLLPTAAIRRSPTNVALPSVVVEPATFRAEGRFFDPRAPYVNRLAPMPGILAYANGLPIDSNGKPLQDHFVP